MLCGPTVFSEGFLAIPSAVILRTPIEAMVGAPVSLPLSFAFAAASPAARITNTPTLLIRGTKDLIVPYESSTFLATALGKHKVTHKLVTITDAGHDLGLVNPQTSALILKEMLYWITIYSK